MSAPETALATAPPKPELPVEALEVLRGERQWWVIEGDCLKVLPLLGPKSVDHAINDPPYSDWVHARVRRGGSVHAPDSTEPGKPKRAVISTSTVLGFEALTSRVRSSVARRLGQVARRWVLVFTDLEGLSDWRAALRRGGLQHVRSGVWVKLGATPQFTGDRPGTGAEGIEIAQHPDPDCDGIEIAHPPGRKRWNGGGKHGVWTHPIVPGADPERGHPTQKPLPLMLELVEDFTDEGELVLDAFAGSGTTGVACVRRGRRFLGIEKSPEHVALARERLAAEARGLRLQDARAGQLSLLSEAR